MLRKNAILAAKFRAKLRTKNYLTKTTLAH